MSTYLPIRPRWVELSGGYTLVEEDVPVEVSPCLRRPIRSTRGNPLRIWFREDTGDVIREELRPSSPYRQVMLDFDGAMVNSEGMHGIFGVAWRTLFRNAGLQATDYALERLRKKVYKWDRTLPHSTKTMIERIKSGRSIHGDPLPFGEQYALQKVLHPDVLKQWAEINGRAYKGDVTECAHEIIADRKEAIGEELLRRNPGIVRTLAPFQPGAVDFLKRLHQDTIVGIASASRVRTTILPILEAHANIGERYPLDRIGSLIVGEDTMYGGAAKPERRFYENVIITGAHILRREGKIPAGGVKVSDIVHIGDMIARSSDPDAPRTRKSMHHIVLQPGNEVDAYGPLAAVMPDVQALAHLTETPMGNITNPTLQRLKLTLRAS